MFPEDFCVDSVKRWEWTCSLAPRGLGSVLIARAPSQGAAWVIAPPAVSLLLGESDDERRRWRVARYYASDPEGLVIVLGEHVPNTLHEVTIDDVRLVAPVEHQRWITGVCERQLALADGFGRQDPRVAPNEERVRRAAAKFAEVAGHKESKQRAKDEFEGAIRDVPNTVEELLGRATGQTQQRSPREVVAAAAVAWRSPALVEVVAVLAACVRRSAATEREPCVEHTARRPSAKPAHQAAVAGIRSVDSPRNPSAPAWLITLVTGITGAVLTATAFSIVQGGDFTWLSLGLGATLTGGVLRSALLGRGLLHSRARHRSAGRAAAPLAVAFPLIAVAMFGTGSMLAVAHVQAVTQRSETATRPAALAGRYYTVRTSDGTVILSRPGSGAFRYTALEPAAAAIWMQAMRDSGSWLWAYPDGTVNGKAHIRLVADRHTGESVRAIVFDPRTRRARFGGTSSWSTPVRAVQLDPLELASFAQMAQ